MNCLRISLLAPFRSSFYLRGSAPVESGNPTIGGVDRMLATTRPGSPLPKSMVRVDPVWQDQLGDHIQSFPLTNISHRLGKLFALMPAAKAGPAA